MQGSLQHRENILITKTGVSSGALVIDKHELLREGLGCCCSSKI